MREIPKTGYWHCKIGSGTPYAYRELLDLTYEKIEQNLTKPYRLNK